MYRKDSHTNEKRIRQTQSLTVANVPVCLEAIAPLQEAMNAPS